MLKIRKLLKNGREKREETKINREGRPLAKIRCKEKEKRNYLLENYLGILDSPVFNPLFLNCSFPEALFK